MIHWGNMLRLCVILVAVLGFFAFYLGSLFLDFVIFCLAGGVGAGAYAVVMGLRRCFPDKWPWLSEGKALVIGVLVFVPAYWFLEALAVRAIRFNFANAYIPL